MLNYTEELKEKNRILNEELLNLKEEKHKFDDLNDQNEGLINEHKILIVENSKLSHLNKDFEEKLKFAVNIFNAHLLLIKMTIFLNF